MRAISILVLMTSFHLNAFAAEAKKETPARKPASETNITIKAFPQKYSGWFVERKERGVMGAILSRVVPVTREASAQLASLDTSKTHQCDFTDSTFAGEYEKDLAGNYFVIDLVCK